MRRGLKIRPRLGGDFSVELVATYEYDPWGKLLAVKDADGNAITSSGHAAIKNPLRYRGYYYDIDSGFYYLQSRYYDPQIGRFINADRQTVGVNGNFIASNLFAYCLNSPVGMSDSTGNWPKWLEKTVKAVSIAVLVAAVVVTVAVVSAYSAGTASAAAVYGASILLSAAISGISAGVANEKKGNSYINGYIGGSTGGAIQAISSKAPAGTIWGGAIGSSVSTTITGFMNNLDPDSHSTSGEKIAEDALISGGKAIVTSSVTAFVSHASDLAVASRADGLMPEYSFAFGEAVKAFFGWADDAVIYIWE